MRSKQTEISEDILIVDDTTNNLRLLSQMLTEHGYGVRAVTSGERALASAQVTPPSLILLDIKMPEMNGYEVCQRLKADKQTRDIPIIFISALDDVQDKVNAFTVGGVDYITKPFQLEEVLARSPEQDVRAAIAPKFVGSIAALEVVRAGIALDLIGAVFHSTPGFEAFCPAVHGA